MFQNRWAKQNGNYIRFNTGLRRPLCATDAKLEPAKNYFMACCIAAGIIIVWQAVKMLIIMI